MKYSISLIELLLAIILTSPAFTDWINSQNSFQPLDEGNIYIYVSQSHGYGPPGNPDTVAYVIEQSSINPSFYRFDRLGVSFVRPDENGNLWAYTDRTEVINRFNEFIQSNPDLQETTLYSQWQGFVHSENQEVLLYNFTATIYDSLLSEEEQGLLAAYKRLQEDAFQWQVSCGPTEDPDVQACSAGSDAREYGTIQFFTRGIGLSKILSFSGISSRKWTTQLIYARIGNREIGNHPGGNFPFPKTVIMLKTWARVKHQLSHIR